MKLRVYWEQSDSGKIESDIVAGVEDRGRVIRFADGNWNPTADCYLTEKQCRQAKRLPPVVPKTRKAALEAALLMNKAIEKIEDALEKEKPE